MARINEDPKDALLRKYQEEIEKLKKQIENDEISGGESAEEDDNASNASDHGNRKRAGSVSNQHWQEKIREMETDIASKRKQLDQEKNMAEGERRKIAEELLQKEEELKRSKNEHEKLMNKLAAIEKKLIIGGENMLEKAEKQARLLEESNRYY